MSSNTSPRAPLEFPSPEAAMRALNAILLSLPTSSCPDTSLSERRNVTVEDAYAAAEAEQLAFIAEMREPVPTRESECYLMVQLPRTFKVPRRLERTDVNYDGLGKCLLCLARGIDDYPATLGNAFGMSRLAVVEAMEAYALKARRARRESDLTSGVRPSDWPEWNAPLVAPTMFDAPIDYERMCFSLSRLQESSFDLADESRLALAFGLTPADVRVATRWWRRLEWGSSRGARAAQADEGSTVRRVYGLG